MLNAGNILYCTPFYFQDGSCKNKYFIVLAKNYDDIVVANLPTSKDHVPNFITKRHGCLNNDDACFNCYYFEKNKIISENNFAFPRDTYLFVRRTNKHNEQKRIRENLQY
ncbi:MAG: hypothetical protein LBS50_01100 [Prevotellaceae bacterium]|jgi:hypothetical protein|nr:hypothetical protein [Prevotellaceae bacterium]